MFSLEPLRALLPCALFIALLNTPLATAQPPGKSSPAAAPQPAHRPGELVVRFRPNAHASDRAAARALVGGRLLRDLGFLNAEHLRLQGVGVAEAIGRLRNHPMVEYAEPNFEVRVLLAPNDPQFPQMYNLQNTGQTGGTPGADIRATQAWDLFTGDPELKVGVIDTGVDYNHPDLAANIWTNPGETPGNGIDDDGNGYVDDVHGYDFANGDPDPFDDHGHGTHVSGTIAAVGNNGVGVVGVNWHARIVGIKFLNASGSGSTAGAIAAVGYAIAAGVRLTNNSWGGGAYSQGLLDAINAAGAAGQLFVAAAGNSGLDTDVFPQYPAAYNSPYIVSVAATDHNDQLASFSNYGATTVDLGAPGVNILSTLPGAGYGTLSGTSMASPHVAGAAAFVLGRFPGMQALQAKSQILSAVDALPSLAGRVLSGGRLNLFRPVLEPDEIPPGAITDLAAVDPGSSTMELAWTATGDDDQTGRAVRYEIRYSTVPITEANFGSLPLAPGPTPLPAGSAESAEVQGLAFSTPYYFAIKAFDEVGNPGPISNLATGTTLGIPDVTVTPVSFSQELLTGARATQSLTLRNDGEGTLDFSVPDPELAFAQPVHEALALERGEPDPRPGILGSGGPDQFGYRWKDSDQPGGPPFQWVDIVGVGTQLPFQFLDQNITGVPIGFSFPFYGNSFSTVNVCTHGWMSFTSGIVQWTNQPLPSPGAPENLVAAFWDDLNVPAGGQVWYQATASRFVLSWIGVPRTEGGGPETFQIILYPDGQIVTQYLTMLPPVNSATIGIQNGARNDGLTVVFNSSYVHDNLAVRIFRPPPWLDVSPRSGRVHAGQETQLTLGFDALGMVGGDYDAQVRVLSNDPDESDVSIPVQLHVIGAPDLAVSPASLDFGTVFVGSVTTRTLIVSNPGTDNLVVSDIASGDPAVTATPRSFTVLPFGAQSVQVTYAPAAPGPLNDALTITSNDPDATTRQVPLLGSAVPPPVVSVTPQSLSATVPIPGMTTQTLTIQNSGGSPLLWSLQTQGVSTATGSGPVAGPLPTEWGSDPRFGAPGGPVIAVDADPLVQLPVVIQDPTGDGGSVDLTALRGSGTGGLLQVQLDLSTSLAPSNFGGFVSLDVDRNRFTGSPPSFGAPGQDIGAEYEVLLFSLLYGQVDLYSTTGTYVGSFPATVGAQSLRFSIPLAYLGDDDGDMDVTGVIGTSFGPTDWFPDSGHGTILAVGWLATTPDEGVVAPGESADVTVTYDTAGLIGGQYLANLALTTNDPQQPRLDIPVQLTAVGVPDIAVDPASLDFGSLFVGLSRDLSLQLSNPGSERLQVASGDVSGSGFLRIGGSFPIVLEPGDQVIVTVRFTPTAPCSPCTGQLTFQSDDPDENPLVVPLTGVGLPPPDIAVSPASLEASLLSGETTTQTLRIDNVGDSPLVWDISSRPSFQSAAEPRSATPSTWQVLGPAPSGGGVNHAGGAPAAQAVRATYGAAVTGPRILLYSDEYTAGPGSHTSDLALQSLGLAYTAYYNDPSGFGNALLSQTWDLVIVNHANYFELGNWWSEIETFLNDGGRALIGTFDVDGSNSEPTTLWSTVGLAPRGDILGVSPVYWWEALHPLFNQPEEVPPFLQMSDFYFDDGDRAGAAAGTGDPAGFTSLRTTDQSAIVVSANRRAIVNSFIVSENQADRDVDGKPDAVELWMNEIGFLSGVGWLSADPAEGTVPPGGSAEVAISFDASGLLGGDYYADLVVASNDPDEPESHVPTHLHVTGVPDIAVERLPQVIESSVDYVGSGARTTHTLPVTIPPPADGVFELVADGDYGFAGETATLTAEGYTLGRVGEIGSDCAQARGEFAVDAGTLAALTADGVVNAVVQNGLEVNDFCALNRHVVRLRYPLPAESIDYGNLFVGLCARDSVRVRNRGTDSLRVSSVQVNHPAFSVDPSAFVLAVEESRTVVVTYCPPATGLHQGLLTIQSNDPDVPTVSVNLRGVGVEPPDIAVSPTQVVASLPIPATETRTLAIQNTGGSDLQFTAHTDAIDSTTVGHEALALAKGEEDPRPGILGGGGPDPFGYRWEDSDEPGGPPFQWVDITGLGQPVPISGDDAISGAIAMGMNFSFYGSSFNTVYICTNGFLTFSPGTGAPFFNQPLPNLGAPPNQIAPFWEDLILLGQDARTYFDGSRFIVSWIGVYNYSGGGPYTFQAILYPSGEIRFQFLSMAAPINSATVGIQNGTRNVGLTVAFNRFYIHTRLAVRISPLPAFLTVQPSSGVVPPGGSLDLQLELSTAGLSPGVYRETVTIASNDPDESIVPVPVVLNAVLQPDIAVNPPAIDFGTVFIGQAGDRTLQVSNTGMGVLELTGATVTGAGFSLVGGVFPALINPGQSTTLTARFAPSSVCTPCTGALVLQSDDPDENPLTVPLSGTGVPPPDVEVNPDSLRAAGATTIGPLALQRTKTLVVSNTGGSDLQFTVHTVEIGGTAAVYEALETLAKDEPDPRPGVLGSGGPDHFGYRWVDSDQPGGPAFQWVDITGVGQLLPISGDDGTIGPIAMGMSFPFYGNSFNSVYICTNGFVTFTPGTAAPYINQPLPSLGALPDLIATFWDDLILPIQSIYTHYDGSRFIVSWIGVNHFGSGGPYTFQAILYPSGEIRYQFLSMGPPTNSATVGMQNGARDDGLTVVFNSSYVHDGLAVRFRPAPRWLSAQPTSGTVPPGASLDVDVELDATDLPDGDYGGDVEISSNDPDEPFVAVPCRFHVGVMNATFDVDPNSLTPQSQGNWVSTDLELDAGLDPHAIALSTLRLQRAVPVDEGAPISYHDDDQDGFPQVRYKFDRASLHPYLAEGELVPIEVIGEVEDVTWFQGLDLVRSLPPGVPQPPGAVYSIGMQVPLAWNDPPGHPAVSHDLWFSADDGGTWQLVASSIMGSSYLWTVPAQATDQGRLELVAFDDQGAMGSWVSEQFQILASLTAVVNQVPKEFGLRLAGPNPGRGSAGLELGLPERATVVLRVFDVRGALVSEIARGELDPGWHRVTWNGANTTGAPAPAGIYFANLTAGGRTIRVRLALLR